MMAYRLGAFLAVFALVALWEALAPLHRAARGRWPVNLGLIVLDTVLVRLLGPVSAVGANRGGVRRVVACS